MEATVASSTVVEATTVASTTVEGGTIVEATTVASFEYSSGEATTVDYSSNTQPFEKETFLPERLGYEVIYSSGFHYCRLQYIIIVPTYLPQDPEERALAAAVGPAH